MSKLYRVPGYSVVFANNHHSVVRALNELDHFDAWVVDKVNIQEITDTADLPNGWNELQSAVDACRRLDSSGSAWKQDPWTLDCIETIVKKQKDLDELAITKKAVESLLSKIALLEHQLASTTQESTSNE